MNTEKHKCFVAANKMMAEDNTEIEFVHLITKGYALPAVRTMKIDSAKRGKPKTIFISYCPFCGSALQKDTVK